MTKAEVGCWYERWVHHQGAWRKLAFLAAGSPGSHTPPCSRFIQNMQSWQKKNAWVLLPVDHLPREGSWVWGLGSEPENKQDLTLSPKICTSHTQGPKGVRPLKDSMSRINTSELGQVWSFQAAPLHHTHCCVTPVFSSSGATTQAS